jgi:predicted amidohydrolase
MQTKIKIGTWQGPVADNDLHKNLQKVKSILEDSQSSGLDFLCFPETYLSGYSPRAIQESACALDHPEITNFIDESKKYATVILVGMSEKVKDKIYNSQLVIYQGDLLGVARKTILTEYDARYFSTDLSLPVFTAKGIRFGVAICHCTSFVEPALYLRWKGARLLFTPHFNNQPPTGFVQNGKAVSFWEHRTMVLNNQAALATLLKMVVVRSNIVMVEADALGMGDSGIWDMDGVLVAQGQPFTECLVSAEFDRQIFVGEHWIDRREVPLALLDMIAQAAKEYPR